MEAASWLPPGAAAGPLLSLILRLCRAASSIASAIEEFRHLVGSPWISMTRGSSSKKKRREELERQRRLAAAIDMDDMSAEEYDAAAATSTDSGAAAAPSETKSDAAPEPTPSQQKSEPEPSQQQQSEPKPEPAQKLESTRQPKPEPEPAQQMETTQQPELKPEPAQNLESTRQPEPEPEPAQQMETTEQPELKPEPAQNLESTRQPEPEPESAQQMETTEQPEPKPESARQEKSEPASAPSPARAVAAAAEPGGAGPELSIAYFRRLVSSETERLSALAVRWEAVVAAGGLPPEPLGEVHSVTGQARLLVRERFVQFDGLVDGAEFLRGPRPTTLTDLQGFWEMIYFQVEDVDRKFARLEQLQAAGWRGSVARAAPAPAAAPAARARKPPAPAARRPAVKKAGPSAALRAAMLAARKKIKAETAVASPSAPVSAPSPAAATQTPCRAPAVASDCTPAPASAGTDAERRFTGGFFTVATPASPASPASTQEGVVARHQGAELRRSLLLSGARPRRTSDLTPLVRISMSAKLAQQKPSRLVASPQQQQQQPPTPPPDSGSAEEELNEVKALESRVSRRRSALTELTSNSAVAAAAAAARPGRRSRRQPSLLGDPVARGSPLPAPVGGDLMNFDSPAAAGSRRKSHRLTGSAAAEPAAC